MSAETKSGLTITNEVRLSILRRARQILDSPARWCKGQLRLEEDGEQPRYCVLGAIEQAAYDTKVAKEDPENSFDDADWDELGEGPLAYLLGQDLSLQTYSQEEYNGLFPWNVNDQLGYDETLKMLDGYIGEVEAGRARDPEPS